MTQTQMTFPFKLDDLKAWIVHRKDGTVTRFVMAHSAVGAPVGDRTTHRVPSTAVTTTVASRVTSNYAGFCNHTPAANDYLAEFSRGSDPALRLWVGSIGGSKATLVDMDFIVDCGDIFDLWKGKDKLLTGDPELCEMLSQYGDKNGAPRSRLLKIDWDDRQAPDLVPEFWTELNKKLYGNVMTSCVGGHGRSGSAFVCLLLNNAPDYDALDAVIHLRAVHCPRAIESIVQHDYINRVAKYLGRTENSRQAHSITDYKGAFMASTKPTAIETRKRLGWNK